MAAASEAWDWKDVGRGGVGQPAAVEPSPAAGSAVSAVAVAWGREDDGPVFCNCCRLWLNGHTQWEDRIRGKKHKKKLLQSGRCLRFLCVKDGVDPTDGWVGAVTEQLEALNLGKVVGSEDKQPAAWASCSRNKSQPQPPHLSARSSPAAELETQTPSDDYCKAYAQAIELLLGSGAQADQVEVEAREMAMMAVQERAQRKLRLASMD